MFKTTLAQKQKKWGSSLFLRLCTHKS